MTFIILILIVKLLLKIGNYFGSSLFLYTFVKDNNLLNMKNNDFNSEGIAAVDKMITVLKYLNQGRSITTFGTEIKLGETMNGFQIMMKMDDGTDEGTWVAAPETLDWFASTCAHIPDEDITLMQAELVLQRTKKDR
jgi:hypothetical protein